MGSSSHGDGIAKVEFMGRVVEIVNEVEVPITDVKFSVVWQHSFATEANSRIIFLSNENGEFLSQLYVQAATLGEGKNEGKVYQTGAGKIRLEKDGFDTREILFDYEMPSIVIHLERKKQNKAETATPRKPAD